MKFKKLFSVLCSFTMMISSIFCCKAYPEVKKIVFLGEAGVGKTQILNRWVNNKFDDSYEATLVVRSFFQVPINAGLVDTIWDSAGEKKYQCLLPIYCRDASIAVIVVDLNDDESINGISEFIKLIKETSPNTKILLVGNKLDLIISEELGLNLYQQLSKVNKLRNKAREHGLDIIRDVIVVSAKFGDGINVLENRISEIFKENESKIPTQNNGLTKSTSNTSNIGTSNKYSKYLTGAGLVALIAGTGLLIKKHFTSNDTQKNESL